LTFLGCARRAIFAVALIFVSTGPQFAGPAQAAGAFAIGKCGAYGQAIDYPAELSALAAARKQCGAHGYAVKPQISSSLNAATKKCYDFGGKECVIRAWACDAKG
jgi:hypothetical protein